MSKWGTRAFEIRSSTFDIRNFSSSASQIMAQREELLVHHQRLAFLAQLGEQLPHPAPPGDVEAEGLREVFLRVRGSVARDVVRQGGRYAASLEVHPGIVHAAVGLEDLAKGAPESLAVGPAPVVIQEAVAQLVRHEPHQHGPVDLQAGAPLGHVALFNLHDLGPPWIHAGDARAEEHAVAPRLDAGDAEQAPHAAQGGTDQVLARRVAAAPGAVRHPVVDAAAAVRARALEVVVIAPALVAAAPGAVRHGVLQAAAATPIAARMIAEALGRLERHLARGSFLVDLRTAPGAEPVEVRDHPPAAVALGAGDLAGVGPDLGAAAAGAVGPVSLKLVATEAPQLGPWDRLPPLTVVAHAAGPPRPRPQSSRPTLASPAEGGGAPVNQMRGLEGSAAPRAGLAAPSVHVKRELKPPAGAGAGAVIAQRGALRGDGLLQHGADFTIQVLQGDGSQAVRRARWIDARSEEHTSELQSPTNLVC